MENEKALNAFLERKAQIDDLLAKLTALSDDHFNVAPDDVNWGHVGDLARIEEHLREATGA